MWCVFVQSYIIYTVGFYSAMAKTEMMGFQDHESGPGWVSGTGGHHVK